MKEQNITNIENKITKIGKVEKNIIAPEINNFLIIIYC
jgi:hypothetical protein